MFIVVYNYETLGTLRLKRMENDPVFCDIKTQTFDLKLELMRVKDEICNALSTFFGKMKKKGGHI